MSDRQGNKYLGVKLLCVAVFSLSSLVLSGFSRVLPGLDPSWVYLINLPLKYGQDIIYTYGPLGFILRTANVGDNMMWSLIFWLFVFALGSWCFARLIFKMQFESNRQAALALLSAFIYYVNVLCLPEEFVLVLIFIVVLATSVKISRYYLLFDAILLVLTLLMKAGLGMKAFAAMASFVILSYIFDARDKRFYLITLLSTLLITPLLALPFFDGSFSCLLNYLKGSLEVVSGYGVGMSRSLLDRQILGVVIIAVCVLFLAAKLLREKDSESFLFLIALVPLFMEYKHGFGRADSGHTIPAFLMVGAFCALFLLMLASHTEQRKSDYCGLVICLIVTLVSSFYSGVSFQDASLTMLRKNIRFPKVYSQIRKQDLGKVNPLPLELLDAVGDKTVSIYPWEISYAASNDINFIPLPTGQAFIAYTPYLDNLNAEFYSSENSPEFIIFQISTVDDRWPLYDCPQTGQAIKSSYQFYGEFLSSENEKLFLLSKKQRKDELDYICDSSFIYSSDAELKLVPGVYKFYAELTPSGKIASLFWKVPEVNMEVNYEDMSSSQRHRIILDNLQGGIDFDVAISPNDCDSFRRYLEGDISGLVPSSIRFLGQGLKLYKKQWRVERYRCVQ